MVDATAARTDLPVGTVTFLRTDVEGSMRLARTLGERWDATNATHLGLIRRVIDANGGVCVRTEGDAFFGVFQEAGAAIKAAIDAQRALTAHAWPTDAGLRVRIGLHSGEAHLAGDDYGGLDVSRAARIAAAGHGGQIVLSEPTRLLSERVLADGVRVRDLGHHVLRDVPVPERLFQVDIPGLRDEFPPLRTTRPATGNLPMRMTSFLGREDDLVELDELLRTNRLVTLTGPGGIGKSSLALELGRAWQDRVPDGVWFVGLDEIGDQAMVRAEIARSLGLFDGPDRPAADGLEPYLADRSMVLVIDNFEHVLEAARELGAILRASPATRIVATSRAPLRVPGEQEYPVRPLVDGQAGSELFVQRARAVRPGWDPGVDRVLVDEITSILDGLPLGIELAAARVSLLPLPAIRDRLAARLPLPGSGPRDVPERQRTLEAAIAWSYDLLGEVEQRLLQDLAVFDGSFDVEQASAVYDGDVLDGLATLAEHSLIVAQIGGSGAIRYRLLQTIRGFAHARLVATGRGPDARRRHALGYLALTEEAAPYLPGMGQVRWLDRLTQDHANIRAATRWAIESGEVELAQRLVGSTWRFWQLDGHLAEGAELTTAAIEMLDGDAPTLARLRAVTAAGGIAYWRGDSSSATRLYEEQRDIAVALGDQAQEADAHFNLIFARNMDSGAASAWEEVAEAVRIYGELGDEQGIARTGWIRGGLTLEEGDAVAAVPIFEESLAEAERVGDGWYHAIVLGSLAGCYFELGQPMVATRYAVRALVECHAMRDVTTTTITLAPAGRIALEMGMPEEAAMLVGAFQHFCELYGVRPPSGVLQLISGGRVEERVMEALGVDELAQAIDHGRRLTLDESVALVVDVCDRVMRRGPPGSGPPGSGPPGSGPPVGRPAGHAPGGEPPPAAQ